MLSSPDPDEKLIVYAVKLIAEAKLPLVCLEESKQKSIITNTFSTFK